MRNRRGVAMLAALWLVVGITVVAVEFSLVGRERRQVGIAAADRAHASAGALGAFATTRARLEAALRAGPTSTAGAIGSARGRPMAGRRLERLRLHARGQHARGYPRG